MRRALTLCCCVALSFPATALAWSPLRAKNPRVEEGNELMAQAQYADALEAYDEAARELPDARAVQLNRGLALLSQDLTEPSKEAFVTAADPSAAPEIRADAYYNLGIAHARQGDALSEQEDFEGASTQFREAANAFKRSLRLRPGNRSAAWNLEYALQRIREEEQKQEQSREQSQEQNQDQSQDQEQEQNQDQEQNSESDSASESESESESDSESESESEPGSEPDSEPEPESDSEPEPEPDSEPAQPQQMQPSEVERFLDALEQNEESLPLQRARRRSAGRRPPEKDW